MHCSNLHARLFAAFAPNSQPVAPLLDVSDAVRERQVSFTPRMCAQQRMARRLVLPSWAPFGPRSGGSCAAFA